MLSAALASLAAPVVVHAQDFAGADAEFPVVVSGPTLLRPFDPRRGLEVDAQAGVGGFANDSASAFTQNPRGAEHLFWPGFGTHVHLGYRAVPWFSAGAHLAYQNNTSRELPQGVTGAIANAFALGVYTRFYLGAAAHWRVFDPWIGVGVDPFAGVFVRNHTALGDVVNQFAAVAIPISIGADFYVSPRMALGATAQISPWIPWQACQTLEGNGSSCTRSNLDVNTYAFAGLHLRYTFGE
jgi:hypothetical protein